jgi:hypothetical protein
MFGLGVSSSCGVGDLDMIAECVQRTAVQVNTLVWALTAVALWWSIRTYAEQRASRRVSASSAIDQDYEKLWPEAHAARKALNAWIVDAVAIGRDFWRKIWDAIPDEPASGDLLEGLKKLADRQHDAWRGAKERQAAAYVRHLIDYKDGPPNARYIFIELRSHRVELAQEHEPVGSAAYNDLYEALSVIEAAMEQTMLAAVPFDWNNRNFHYGCKSALRFWKHLDRIGYVNVWPPKNDEEAEREKDELADFLLKPLSLVQYRDASRALNVLHAMHMIDLFSGPVDYYSDTNPDDFEAQIRTLDRKRLEGDLRGTVRAAMQPVTQEWKAARAKDPAHGLYEEPIYRTVLDG